MLVGCMKAISGLGAFIILIVGLGMTGITIYGFTHTQIFLNDTHERSTILGILIAADIIIVFGSILGIYGLKKNNGCLICIFQILVILFLVIFLSLGIAAKVLPSKFFDGKCEASNNPTLALAYNTTVTAELTFCLLCQCNLKESTITNSAYNPFEQAALSLLFNRNQSTGYHKFQQCPKVPQQQKDMGTALGVIEETFGCAGWCSPDLVYRFSDINKVRPNGNCYNVISDQIDKYSNIVSIGAFITAAFLLFISVINICLCCQPARRKLSLKNRFVYMKDGEYSKI